MGALIRSSAIIFLSMFILLIAAPATSSFIVNSSSVHVYEARYSFLESTLSISIQPSLYVYYSNLSHTISDDSQYARFVTPKAIQPIADNLLNRTKTLPNPEEQFANQVLAFVHQIPYNITGAKYPVETLVDNQGDCGAISLLAASIMKAGGLDVVLIKYVGWDFAHMNVGVDLPSDPVYKSLFFSSTSFEYNNKTYWPAEATPQANWKVGDQPSSMAGATTEIISVDQDEDESPGQVVCSLDSRLPSSISLETSKPTRDTVFNRSLLIWGSTVPELQNVPVTVYIVKDGRMDFIKTTTDNQGNYSLLWNFTKDGAYNIITSYSGNETFAGADSEVIDVFIGPPSLLQFQAETYSYILGVPIGDVAIRPYMGVKDFLSSPIKVANSFSYSFSIHSTGHMITDVNTTNITLQADEQIVRGRNRNSQIIQVPSKTLTSPENIPLGLKPLALPPNFNETIQNQFCFIVEKTNDGNYTLNAQGLDSLEASALKAGNSSTIYVNATNILKEDQWYRVSTTISNNVITTTIKDDNGNIIQNISPDLGSVSCTNLILDVANNIDSAIVVKNLQINDKAEDPAPVSQIVHLPPEPPKSLIAFATAIVIISIALTVTGITIKTMKKRIL